MADTSSRNGRPPAVTRADVARYAGVSTAVVSYVVNGGPKAVSEATAAKVRAAIAQLGYRPNSTARALALGSTRTLGLVVPDGTSPFYAELTLEIQRAAASIGYAVLTTSTGFDPEVELRSILDLCDRQLDGLLLARATGLRHLTELTRHGVQTPVVLIDSATPFPGCPTVGPNATEGIAEAVDHLLRVHRHHSVALIMGDTADTASDGRETGWMQAHARRGRTPGPIDRTAFTRAGGYAAGRRLLDRANRPRAIVTSSDLQAIGLLRAAHELGLRVPGDLAVASFDGTEETEYCWPSLTTSRQPTTQMAHAAVQAALRVPPEQDHQTFAMELTVRESCGCTPS